MKLVVFVALVCLACNTGKQGTVKQGKDGKIESAKITAKCTPPQKSYAKEIEAKLKAEMDTLRFTSISNFDASFSQKVVKLRDYSSQGLDLDLLLFRICEMANNRGFTSEQTTELLNKAIDIWNGGNKTTTLYQTIISNNQTGGYTAGIIVVPEDKEIPLNNNFQILKTKSKRDSIWFDAIEARPRHGHWFRPYFAYPYDEDSLVQGQVAIHDSGVFFESSSFGTIKYGGQEYKLRIVSISCNS